MYPQKGLNTDIPVYLWELFLILGPTVYTVYRNVDSMMLHIKGSKYNVYIKCSICIESMNILHISEIICCLLMIRTVISPYVNSCQHCISWEIMTGGSLHIFSTDRCILLYIVWATEVESVLEGLCVLSGLESSADT